MLSLSPARRGRRPRSCARWPPRTRAIAELLAALRGLPRARRRHGPPRRQAARAPAAAVRGDAAGAAALRGALARPQPRSRRRPSSTASPRTPWIRSPPRTRSLARVGLAGTGGAYPEDRPPRHRGASRSATAVRAYEALGFTVDATHDVPTEKVRTAFLPVGESHLELLEPTDPASVIARFLEKRSGLHHVCVAVPDIEAALDELAARGVELLDREAARRRGRAQGGVRPSAIGGGRPAGAGGKEERVSVTAEIGIIGGSGLYEMEGFTDVARGRGRDAVRRAVRHAHGRARSRAGASPSCPRHGRGHRILPSELNFRANIFALKTLGVERILSVSAVGLAEGEVRAAAHGDPRPVRRPHRQRGADLLRPRAGRPRRLRASRSARDLARGAGGGLRGRPGPPHHDGGTYVCIEGPQFSTRAESELYRSWGMDVIGMTNLQEARLAREAEICYATLAMVTDYDCWHPDHDVGHRRPDHRRTSSQNAATAKAVLRAAVQRVPREPRALRVRDRAAPRARSPRRSWSPPQVKRDLAPDHRALHAGSRSE